MTIAVNIHDAKTQFSKLVARAERGETILIARAGKTVARLTPDKAVAARMPKRFGFMQGELKIPGDFDTMFQDEIVAMFEGTN